MSKWNSIGDLVGAGQSAAANCIAAGEMDLSDLLGNCQKSRVQGSDKSFIIGKKGTV